MSKFVHLTLCRLSNACRKILLNSFCIRRRMEVGKMGFWRACSLILGLTADFSSRRRDISYMAGWNPSSPSNTVQKTAQASSWDDALSQPAMGETFFFPVSRLVSVKEVKALPPKIASHFYVRRAASKPAKG